MNQFDLKGVEWPVCLLKCKRKLDEMRQGEMLDIRVQDPEMVVDLVRIIECSMATILKQEPQADGCRIVIRKNGQPIERL